MKKFLLFIGGILLLVYFLDGKSVEDVAALNETTASFIRK